MEERLREVPADHASAASSLKRDHWISCKSPYYLPAIEVGVTGLRSGDADDDFPAKLGSRL